MLALYGLGGTALLVTSPTVAPTTGTAQPMYLRTVAPRMAFYPVAQTKPKTPLKNAIKKRSGAHTVSIEVLPAADGVVASIDAGELAEGTGARRTTTLTASERLSKVSAELRGGRDQPVLAASIWTPDVESLSVILKEQATARGDFPGPCPVVFNGDASDAQAAVEAGANGVVLTASDLAMAKALDGDVEIVWSVSSADEIALIVSDESMPEDAFLIGGGDAAALVAELPPSAVAIASVDAMQPEDGEVAAGRELASLGCKALLVRGACVGDSEDVAYSKYVVKELTSKKSSTFKIDGHTGAVNGHFGGPKGSTSSPKDGWKRKAAKS